MTSPGPSVMWPPGSSPYQLQPGQVRKSVWIPLWSAPGWEDEGEARQNCCYPVRDSVLDVVRPAMHQSDDAKNPTEYARRFGIFPGRTDGRSRTSPTRSPSRQIQFPNGVVRSGQDVFNHFEELARSQNQDLDEIMTDGAPHLRNMELEEQAFMDAYEDLTVDEFWQGVLFGDMTMDELKAGDHFPMGPAPSDLYGLRGPLHPLLERSRWSQDAKGYATRWPNFIYVNDSGLHVTVDAGLDNFLWNAMQPALQLATRLMEAKEPYYDALRDVRKWCFVDPALDMRLNAEKQTHRMVKFCRDPPYGKTIVGSLNLRPSAGFDPAALSWRVLEREVVIRLCGGQYMANPQNVEFTRNYHQGLAWAAEGFSPDKPITVHIGLDTVLPLLTSRYSGSERMMASYILAITIAHEFVHVYEYAPCKWSRNPEAYGITDPVDLNFCYDFATAVWGPVNQLPKYGPIRFEDVGLAEAGHSYETHVLGGGTWPMNGVAVRLAPDFLNAFSGIGARVKWPSMADAASRTVSFPPISPDLIVSYVRLQEIYKLFTEGFWRVSVEKYGMAAVRDATNTLSKVYFNTEAIRDPNILGQLSLFEGNYWKTLSELICELWRSRHYTILYYMKLLIQENCQFEFMLLHFMNDAEAWALRDETLQHNLAHVLMIACEASVFFYEQQNISASDRRDFQRREFEAWQELRRYGGGNPDVLSPRRVETLAGFIDALGGSAPSYDDRITRPLADLCCNLQEEQFRQESLLTELYKFPAAYWPHYIQGLPGHRDLWVARASRHSTDVRRIMNKMALISDYIPSWHQHWKPKLIGYVLAFDNISMLVQQDSTEVHSNWRELLGSVPMLRASRRKPYERYYFLAKREMMKLTGRQLEILQWFVDNWGDFLNVDNSKLSLPGDETAEMAQRWAGLLEDSVAPVGQRTTWMNIVRSLDQQAAGSADNFVQARVLRREQERDLNLRRAEKVATQFKEMMESQTTPPFQERPSLSERSDFFARRRGPSRQRSASPGRELAGDSSQHYRRQSTTFHDDEQSAGPSRRVRSRHRRDRRPQVSEPDIAEDVPMLEPQIVEAKLSNSTVPFSQPRVLTSNDPSLEQGLGWREVAAKISQPFGDSPAASSSITAKLVPHSYTISDTAIDDLYTAVTQKLQQQSIAEAVPAGQEDPRTARDEEALRAMQEAIREGQETQTQALEKALSYLPAAQKLATEAASKAQKLDKGKGVDRGSSSAAEESRGRRRTRAEDQQAKGKEKETDGETSPALGCSKIIPGRVDDAFLLAQIFSNS